MKNNYATIILLALALLSFIFLARQNIMNPPQASPTPLGLVSPSSLPDENQLDSTPSAVLGIRTKTVGCVVKNSLQDKDCTPGAIFPNVTVANICTPGYSKKVRNVAQSKKDQVYAEYNITSHQPGEYEVDHLISLELGGSNDISNLFPEAAEPRPGYHEKDRFENFLHDEVCSGKITLKESQLEISTDWLKYWQEAGQP